MFWWQYKPARLQFGILWVYLNKRQKKSSLLIHTDYRIEAFYEIACVWNILSKQR